jgi:transaldolase
VSAEVVALESQQMVEEGKRLAGIHPNIVVKVPVTEQGLRACRALREADIRVNVTLCFQASQALLAAKAGATYISPFVGRIDDASGDGMELIHQIRQIYDNYAIDTEILAASIRHPVHVVDAAVIGADCATMPPKVLWQLFDHPLTDKGLAQFLDDWKKLGKEI